MFYKFKLHFSSSRAFQRLYNSVYKNPVTHKSSINRLLQQIAIPNYLLFNTIWLGTDYTLNTNCPSTLTGRHLGTNNLNQYFFFSFFATMICITYVCMNMSNKNLVKKYKTSNKIISHKIYITLTPLKIYENTRTYTQAPWSLDVCRYNHISIILYTEPKQTLQLNNPISSCKAFPKFMSMNQVKIN